MLYLINDLKGWKRVLYVSLAPWILGLLFLLLGLLFLVFDERWDAVLIPRFWWAGTARLWIVVAIFGGFLSGADLGLSRRKGDKEFGWHSAVAAAAIFALLSAAYLWARNLFAFSEDRIDHQPVMFWSFHMAAFAVLFAVAFVLARIEKSQL